jgi:hypothetical protein
VTKCETVTVEITDEDGQKLRLVAQAYTRTEESFRLTIQDHVNRYTSLSIHAQEGMSIADFALYLLDATSKEPKEQ